MPVQPMLPGLHPRMASEQRGPEPTRQFERPSLVRRNRLTRRGLRGLHQQMLVEDGRVGHLFRYIVNILATYVNGVRGLRSR